MSRERSRARVDFDERALGEFLRTDRAANDFLRQEAERILSYAIGVAPRKTGNYVDYLKVYPYRYWYRVISFDYFGHLVEFGSKNNPPYRPITTAAEASGYRFVEDDKPEKDE